MFEPVHQDLEDINLLRLILSDPSSKVPFSVDYNRFTVDYRTFVVVFFF